MQLDSVPGELEFLAELSWVPSSRSSAARQGVVLEGFLARAPDPDLLWSLLDRHRFGSLALRVLTHHGLLERCPELVARIKASEPGHLARQMALLQDETRVRHALEAKKIRHAILKGGTLSHRIYGSPFLRQSKDVDVLVDPDDLWQAVEVLEAEGWREVHPGFPRHPAYRKLLRERWYHLDFRHQRHGRQVELHWHVEGVPGSSLDTAWVPGLLGVQPGEPISAMEFLYLCAHGEHHVWMRMKWLGDLRAILDRHPGVWDESWKLAPSVGMEPILRQVAGLMKALYGFDLQVSGASPQDPILVEAAINALSSAELHQVPWSNGLRGWWRGRAYKRIMGRRLGFRDRWRATLLQLLFSPGDMLILRLPGWALWALPLLRGPILVARAFSPRLRALVREAHEH